MTESMPIYLFPHLPKTGGAMFLRNAESSLKPHQCLRANYSYQQHYFDPRTSRIAFYKGEEDFKNLLLSLSEPQKNQIRLIGGHDVFYGLHRHFSHTAQYFLFIREPIARTISLYNYARGQYEFLKSQKKLDRWHSQLLDFSRKNFLIDQKIPEFEKWLDESYGQKDPFYFTMTQFLQFFGFLDPRMKNRENLFDKFFFVGLTETLNEDKLYLYRKIGINHFWSDKNISHPYIRHSQLAPYLKEKIREKNQDDFELYLQAKKTNCSFKKNDPSFSRTVQRMRIREIASFPLEKSIQVLKTVLRPIIRPFRNQIEKISI